MRTRGGSDASPLRDGLDRWPGWQSAEKSAPPKREKRASHSSQSEERRLSGMQAGAPHSALLAAAVAPPALPAMVDAAVSPAEACAGEGSVWGAFPPSSHPSSCVVAGASRRARRLAQLTDLGLEALRSRHLELLGLEAADGVGVDSLAVAVLEEEAQQRLGGSPTPAPPSPEPQLVAPSSVPRGERPPSEARLLARVPRHLGVPKQATAAVARLPGVLPAAGLGGAADGGENVAEAAPLPLKVSHPHAAGWDVRDPACVDRAKECLSKAAGGGGTLCRDEERRRVVDFARTRLLAGAPGAMYVSGVPGTGKSLTLRELAAAAETWGSPPPLCVSINCMALRDPREVFTRLLIALGGAVDTTPAAASAAGVDEWPEAAALRRLLTQPARKRRQPDAPGAGGLWALLLLDEMDALLSRAQAVLYELFSLPTLPGARCVLVGAANTLNLAERALPRLHARGCEPAFAAFPAYTPEQLARLLRARLDALPWPVFEPPALQLCARRVAAASGDMRKALDAACAAIDLAQAEATAAAETGEEEDEAPAPRGGLVSIRHMSLALSASMKLPVVETIRALPRHHQMTLCTAVLLFRGGARRDASLGELNDAYTALCRRKGLKGLSAVDFSSVVSALADDALLHASQRGREERQRRVALAVHAEDVAEGLVGIRLFEQLIAADAA